jgi:hypothetical protein
VAGHDGYRSNQSWIVDANKPQIDELHRLEFGVNAPKNLDESRWCEGRSTR